MAGDKIGKRIGLGLCITLAVIGICLALSHKSTGKLSILAADKVVDWRQSTTVTIGF